MKKKVKQQNTYSYLAPPDTADTQAARRAAQNVDLSTPITNAYGQAENEIGDDQFYEDSMPEGAKEKIKFSRLFNLRQQKGAALSQAKGQEEQIKTGNMMNMASLTQARPFQTGSTQTISDPMGTITGLLGAGASVASAIPTGGMS